MRCMILICILFLSGCSAIDFIKCGDKSVCNEKWGGLVSECCK